MRENHNDSDLRDVEERLRRASTAPDDAAALSQLRSQVLRMVTTTPSANAWGRRNALAAAAIPLAAAAVIAVSLASTRVTPPTAHTVAQPSPSATPTMPPSKLVEPEVKPSPYISRLQMVTPTLGWATTSDPVGVMDE